MEFKKLDDRDIKIANLLFSNPEATLDYLVELSGIPKTTISEKISKLKKQGVFSSKENIIRLDKIGYPIGFLFKVKFCNKMSIEEIESFVYSLTMTDNSVILTSSKIDLIFIKNFKDSKEVFDFEKILKKNESIMKYSKDFVLKRIVSKSINI